MYVLDLLNMKCLKFDGLELCYIFLILESENIEESKL